MYTYSMVFKIVPCVFQSCLNYSRLTHAYVLFSTAENEWVSVDSLSWCSGGKRVNAQKNGDGKRVTTQKIVLVRLC